MKPCEAILIKTDMAKILVISYSFPPCGGSPVPRKIGFTENLKVLGHELFVLTVREETYQKLLYARIDNSFDENIKNLQIFRTRAFTPTLIIKILHKLRLSRLVRMIFPICPTMFWTIPATLKGLKIIKKEKINLIISMSMPIGSHFPAYVLHKITKLPWIGDYADPIAHGFQSIWFTKLNYKLMQYIEKVLCRNAAGSIMISPTSKDILLSMHPRLDSNKAISITNAYDVLHETKRSRNPSNKFKIVHSGNTGGHFKEKGKTRSLIKRILSFPIKLMEYRPHRADYSQQSLEPLFRAVRKIIDEKPDLKEKIEIVLNGGLHPKDKILTEILDIQNIVKVTGTTTHTESLNIINKADLLYFPLPRDIQKEKNYCITSKIFFYIASLNPILAPIQDGDAKEIITKTGLGIFLKPLDIDELKNAILTTYNEKMSGIESVKPDIDYIKTLSRLEKTKELNELIKKALEKTDKT